MGRQERFEEQQKQQKRAEAKAKQGSFTPFEHPEYVALEKGRLVVVRPMDTNPPDLFEELDGSSNRFFHQTWMLADDKKTRFPFNWGFEPWNKHPIYDLVRVVASGKYDAENRRMHYDNEGCELLLDITTNSDPTNIMERGWRGTKFVLMNVIDRMDDWCVENNHCKVLVKDATFNADTNFWNATPGMPVSVCNEMFRKANDNMYPIDGIDFAIIRYLTPKINNTEKIYYDTYLGSEERVIMQYNTPELDYSKLVNVDDTTEEEFSYGKYNFAEMPLYRTSSVSTFMRKKGKFVKAVDKKYHTNFFDQFSAIAEKEKEAYKEEIQEARNTTVTKENDIPSKPVVENPVVETPSVPDPSDVKPIRREIPQNDLDIDTSVFKGYNSLSAEEKAMIVGIGDNQELIYSDDVTEADLDVCQKCDCNFPLSFQYCPKCNTRYQ